MQSSGMSEEKYCHKCASFKPLDAFTRCKRGKFGRQSYYRPCMLQVGNKWRKDNPEKIRQSRLSTSRKALYGVTPEQVNALLQKQNGLCAICKQQKKLSLDHNHATEEVRGLLCTNCNFVLGHAQDNLETLRSAIEYLISNDRTNNTVMENVGVCRNSLSP